MARILDSSETFPSTNLPDEESSVVSFGMFLYNFFCDYNLEPWLLLFLFLANMFLSFWLPTQVNHHKNILVRAPLKKKRMEVKKKKSRSKKKNRQY